MDRRQWLHEILQVPVFDTHTHLNQPGVPVPARDFWDIAHYFWFLQELWAVGYPQDAEALPEAERIEHFVAALQASRNTVWNQVVRHTIRALYGIALDDAQSVRRADEAIRESYKQPDWPRRVIGRLDIRHIAVNHRQQADLPGLAGVGVAVPVDSEVLREDWARELLSAADQREVGRELGARVGAAVEELYEQGIRGVRVNVAVLRGLDGEALADLGDLPRTSADASRVEAFLTHTLLEALSERDMFAQLFIGISRVSENTSMAVDDAHYITDLYPLYERYACGFELVIGAPGSNLDAVQPARIYPNVHLGGLWWYNFRSSTYRQAMQYRLEAVPAAKCALVASDARCIEWCYAKIYLVKRLLADFLHEQIEGGWINRGDALWLAREWLHDAAARRYLPQRAAG